jgi:hypothetical protein
MRSFLVLLSFVVVGLAKAQTDTTSSNDYFLTFVKKVYLNPTVYLRTTDFKERTNIGFVALPDLSSTQNNASSGFEKGLQKLLRLLMQTDGGIRFYFNPDNPTEPFTFWCTDNLWCKFKQPEKDSIHYYLNNAFSDSNIDLSNNQRFESTIDNTLDYIERVLSANPGECGEQPQNETTTINTKPLAINIHNTGTSKYDIDYKNYERLASNYAVAFDEFTQQEWFAPSKMFVTGGGAEPLTMSIDLHDPQFKKENLKIEILKTHTVLAHTYSNDSVRFSLPENLSPSDPMEIVVKYKSQVDSVNYTVGLFMVNVVEEKKNKVVLLGANGYGVTPNDVSLIQAHLNEIYSPAGARFEVSKFTHVFMNDYPTTIDDEGSGLVSNYPSDLREYVGDIKDLNDFDGDTYYLVLGLNSSNPDLLGYMPRARNIGFIFFPEGSSDYSVETVAHELGHGIFHFRHIFSDEELGESVKGSTQNVMDYSASPSGDLYLHQWNFIQNPAFVSWSEGDDEDAEIRSRVSSADLLPLRDGEFFHFITPDRKYISLPVSIIDVELSLLDRYTSKGSVDGPNTEFEAPIGSLVAFRDKNGVRWSNVGGSSRYVNRDSGTEVEYKPGDYDESSYGVDANFSTTGAIVSWVTVVEGKIKPIYFKRFLENFDMGTLFSNPYYTLICYQDFSVCGDFTHMWNKPMNWAVTVTGTQSDLEVVRGDLNIRFVLEPISLIDTNSTLPPLPPNAQTKRFSDISIEDLFGAKQYYAVPEIIAYLSFMDMKQQDVNALANCSAVETSNTVIRIREILKGPWYIPVQQLAPNSQTIVQTVYVSQIPAMQSRISTLLSNNLTDYLQRLNLNGVSMDLVYQSLENYKQVVIADPFGVDEENEAWQNFLYNLYNLDVCNYAAINLVTRLNLINDIVLPDDNLWECSSQRGQSVSDWIKRPLLYDLIWTTPENQKNEIYKIFFKDGAVTPVFQQFWTDMDNGVWGEFGNLGYDAREYEVGKKVIKCLMNWTRKMDNSIFGNPDKMVPLICPVTSPVKEFLDGASGQYELDDLYLPLGDVNSDPPFSDVLILGLNQTYSKEVQVPIFKLLGSYDKPVKLENGKFYIDYNYRLGSISLTQQGVPKWNTVDTFFTAVGTKVEVSPFQMIEVILTRNYSDLGMNRGETLKLSILEIYLLQRDIDEAEQAADARILTVTGSAILTVVTLGETAPLLVAVIASASVIDMYYTSTKNDLSTTEIQNSYFYSHWEDIKMIIDIIDIAANGYFLIKPALVYGTKTICNNAKLFNTGRLFKWMNRADKLIDGTTPVGKMADAMGDIRKILQGESPYSITYQYNDMLDISGFGGLSLRGGVVGPTAPFKAIDLYGDVFKSGKMFRNKLGAEFKTYVHTPVKNIPRPSSYVNNYASGATEELLDVETELAKIVELEEISQYSQKMYEMDQLFGTELFESIQEINKFKEINVKVSTSLTIPKNVDGYQKSGKLLLYGTGSGNSKTVTMMAVKYDGKIRVIAATKPAYTLLAQKLKEKEEEQEESCEECTAYMSQIICEKFDRLRDRPLDNTDNFTKLLCGKLNVLKASAVLDWIYEHTDEWKVKLKYDLKWDSTNVNTLSFNRPQIDVNLLEAWILMQRSKVATTGFGQNYCRDYLSLLALSDLLQKQNVVSTLGGENGVSEILKKNTTAPCEVCSNNNPVYIQMDDYIQYVSYFAENYTGKTDYEKVLGPQGIKSGGPNQVNATAFILRVLYENPGYVSTISGFEEKIESITDDGETNRAFADVIENNNKIIECKSWALPALSFNSFCANTAPSGSAQQLITYLGSPNLNSMDDLEYWFDKMKLGGNTDPTPVKEKFQMMWLQNNTLTIKGEAAFTAIFNNTDLKINLFANRNETAARAYFITIISDLENDFYNFIKVK